MNRLCSGYVVSADWQRIADFLSADHIASCTEHGEVRAMRYTYRSLDLAREYALLQYKDITDIRAKERMLEKAQRDSGTDQLTQVFNRRGSESSIREALASPDDLSGSALVLLDLDDFKEVNDRFGHPEGDRVLREAASRLQSRFRSEDIIGRLGGDDWLVLLDIMMPGIDGFGVLEYIRAQNWNDRAVVMMTSSDDSPVNINRAYDLGAFDYISRPFDATIVRRRIVNTLMLFARQDDLERLVKERVIAQQKNNDLMISILSHIVEFRNGESGLHIQYVKEITELLLRRLLAMTDRYQLTEDDIHLIVMASALHDIGKISIPEEILNKPGKLTDEEFSIMKMHSAVDSQMLSDLPADQLESPLVGVATSICRWHHERYDGRGYPDGLTGEEIPVAAQVVSLADVYDALTSERCYKKAFTHEKALLMIVEGQCGTFNPLLLQCLVGASDELARMKRIG